MAVGSDGRIWFSESNNRGLASMGVRVPELLMSTRPLVFADASPKTVSLRNVGNSPLVISAARITGLDAALFATGNDTCSATSLAPDASCEVQLRYAGGGPSGLQSAVLELSDNVPDKVHLLVPRRSRGLRRPPGVVIHTHPDDEKVSTSLRVPKTLGSRSRQRA